MKTSFGKEYRLPEMILHASTGIGYPACLSFAPGSGCASLLRPALTPLWAAMSGITGILESFTNLVAIASNLLGQEFKSTKKFNKNFLFSNILIGLNSPTDFRH